MLYVGPEIVKEYFKLPENADTQVPAEALTYEEANALRYTAGYVCRSVRKKLEAAKHPLMEELMLALVDMCEGSEEEEEDKPTSSKDNPTSSKDNPTRTPRALDNPTSSKDNPTRTP